MTTPEVITLTGEKRKPGRKVADALRDSLRVPAVVYGPTLEENIHFSIDELELEKVLSVSKRQIIELEIDGTSYRSLLKTAEFHPVTDRAIHADFYVMDKDHKVTLSVPLRLTGTATGVSEGGGRIFQPMHILRIRTYPDKIPGDFTLDVTDLDIGDSFHVSDLDLEGIEALDDESRTIVTVVPPKSEALLTSDLATTVEVPEEELEAEGEEPVEGEEPTEDEEESGEETE